MTATCKYCGAQTVTWVQEADGRWALVNADGARHTCPEFYQHRPQLPSVAKRKKAKTGAFLRWYGPRTARAEAMLVETNIDPDSPAGFYHLEPTRSSFEEVQKGRRWPR